MSELSVVIRRDIALQLLTKARKCEALAQQLGSPHNSTEYLCANVWRAAAAIACLDVARENPHG